MKRAIVFDCFGVLTTDGWLPFKEQYFENDPQRLSTAIELNHKVDAGLIDYTEFIDTIARMAGISAQAAHQAIEHNVTNDKLFTYIKKELQPRFTSGILSNAAANWLPDLFTVEQRSMFTAVALSYETGVTKPEARAYEVIADRLGVPSSNCIFIDDQERYCSSAVDADMQAIWYRNFSQMKNELEKLLSFGTT